MWIPPGTSTGSRATCTPARGSGSSGAPPGDPASARCSGTTRPAGSFPPAPRGSSAPSPSWWAIRTRSSGCIPGPSASGTRASTRRTLRTWRRCSGTGTTGSSSLFLLSLACLKFFIVIYFFIKKLSIFLSYIILLLKKNLS